MFDQWANLIDETKKRRAIGDMSVIAYRMAKVILTLQEEHSICKEQEHKMFSDLSKEEQFIMESIVSARKIQTLLWGEANDSWRLEEWRRMFIKRVIKIDPKNPHAIIELKKRLLQNAALSIALMGILHFGNPMDVNDDIPSNLPEYADNKGPVYIIKKECPKCLQITEYNIT